MEHQPGVPAHLNRFSTKGNNRSHTCGNAVNIDFDVGPAAPYGVENGNARIYTSTQTVNPYLNLPVCGFRLLQLPDKLFVGHAIFIFVAQTDIPYRYMIALPSEATILKKFLFRLHFKAQFCTGNARGTPIAVAPG